MTKANGETTNSTKHAGLDGPARQRRSVAGSDRWRRARLLMPRARRPCCPTYPHAAAPGCRSPRRDTTMRHPRCLAPPRAMTVTPNLQPLRVDLVVYPGFKALEAIGPMSVFDYANVHLAQRGRPPGYAVSVASLQTGEVRWEMQMSLQATRRIGEGTLPDIAFIVGSRHIERALDDAPEL